MFFRPLRHSPCFPLNCLLLLHAFLTVWGPLLATASYPWLYWTAVDNYCHSIKQGTAYKFYTFQNYMYIFLCVTWSIGLLHVSPSLFSEELSSQWCNYSILQVGSFILPTHIARTCSLNWNLIFLSSTLWSLWIPLLPFNICIVPPGLASSASAERIACILCPDNLQMLNSPTA